MLKWLKKESNSKLNRGRDNAWWVETLSNPPAEEAIAELRSILVRGLKPALHKYVDRELEEFVEDVAQDALLKIIDRVGTFRGDSKFTTWALKIAVREGLSELRRKKWDDVSLNLFTGKGENGTSNSGELPFPSESPAPDRATHESMVLQNVMSIINEELSPKQKSAMMALMVDDMPITVVAEQMGVKRNALYKLVHDARLNLKSKMESRGINPEEMLHQM